MKGLLVLILIGITLSSNAQSDSAISQQTVAADTVAVQKNDATSTPATTTLLSPDSIVKMSRYGKDDLTVKKFDQQKWNETIKGVNYDEVEQPRTKPRSLAIPWSGPVVRIIAFLIIGGLIVLLVYYLLKNMSWNGAITRKQMTVEDFVKPVEDIKELDFDLLLQEALATGNFRMAVRIYYLSLLKKLNEDGWIRWKKDKTNRDYLSELFARSYHFDEIQGLTLAYERIWYGDHAPSHEAFERLRAKFEFVQQQINTPAS